MKWEYKVIGLDRKSNTEKFLNELGKEEWELINAYYFSGYTFILKRPLRDENGHLQFRAVE